MDQVKVVVGQEVGVRTGINTLFGTVIKVTPTGQCVVQIRPDHTIRFDKEGVAQSTYKGESKWRRYHLVTDVAAERASLELQARKAAAAQALNDIRAVRRPVFPQWGKEDMLERVVELEQLVAAARALVEAI